MTDRIEKQIEFQGTPVCSCVWRALTDHREFGEWFMVNVDGPFVPGEAARGNITYPGYEHVRWEVVVQKMEPERLLFLHVAPVRDRSKRRLFRGEADAGRIRAGKHRRGHAASADRVRIR